jgi:riboflavin synthase
MGTGALMFTGIVEELGRVTNIEPNATGLRITIDAKLVTDDAEIGASIAVNGCCLTVVDHDADSWTADVVEESVRRTNLGALRADDPVNLERPVRLSDRLGGHLVQGHVDAVGTVTATTTNDDRSTTVRIGAPAEVLHYIVEKGSIAVDGVSLTVAAVGSGWFEFAMIPHTAMVTTLGRKAAGATVNLEVDLLAKYVERLVAPSVPSAPN